jgi:hypothetical protein
VGILSKVNRFCNFQVDENRFNPIPGPLVNIEHTQINMVIAAPIGQDTGRTADTTIDSLLRWLRLRLRKYDRVDMGHQM